MEKEAEQSLIKQAQKGQTQAFRKLVEVNQGFAYSLAYRYLMNREDAEDIVQEAFIRTWKNLDRFDFNYRLKTWLGKIIINLCLDVLKSAELKKKMKSMDEDRLITVKDRNETQQELEYHELKDILLKLAYELTLKQRAVFILRDLEQLEPEEVCQALNMSYGNMKSNLYYARVHIKERLTNYYKT